VDAQSITRSVNGVSRSRTGVEGGPKPRRGMRPGGRLSRPYEGLLRRSERPRHASDPLVAERTVLSPRQMCAVAMTCGVAPAVPVSNRTLLACTDTPHHTPNYTPKRTPMPIRCAVLNSVNKLRSGSFCIARSVSLDGTCGPTVAMTSTIRAERRTPAAFRPGTWRESLRL